MGVKTCPRSSPDSYVIDVIESILGRGQSGRIFDELRNKRGLAYEVGVHHDANTDFGFFAVFVNADKAKLKLIQSLVHGEFEKLQSLGQEELDESKAYIEGNYTIELEEPHHMADDLAYWELVARAESEDGYLKRIRKVALRGLGRQ